VNQENWILEADRIDRICKNGLERYEQIMHPFFYKQYVTTRARTRTPSWYSAKVPLEAIAYLIALRDVKLAITEVKGQEGRVAESGRPWTKEETESVLADSVKKALVPALTKAQKIAPILNPAYGNFIAKCAEIYAETNKRRKEKSEGNVLVLNPDRARWFTAVNMDNDLRMALLKAHCLQEKRKEWHHPHGIEEQPVKQWMHT
jgi:hypothetical protein